MYVPLTLENVWYFYFLWVQDVHMFFWEEKQNWSNFPFRRVILFYDENVNWLNELDVTNSFKEGLVTDIALWNKREAK